MNRLTKNLTTAITSHSSCLKPKLANPLIILPTYNEAKNIINTLSIKFNTTTQNEGDTYSVLLGPIENIDANKLVSSFISKGYKKTEIILE